MSKTIVRSPVLVFTTETDVDSVKSIPFVFFCDRHKGATRFMVALAHKIEEDEAEPFLYSMCLNMVMDYGILATPTDYSPDGVELSFADGKKEIREFDLRKNGFTLPKKLSN